MSIPKTIQDVYAMTLDELRAADAYMSSSAYRNALNKEPQDVQDEAAGIKALTHKQRLELGNAVLEKIITPLREQEKELRKAIADLSETRKHIEKVKEFLETLAKALEMVAKVLAVL